MDTFKENKIVQPRVDYLQTQKTVQTTINSDWHLRASIHLLNEFCADTQSFSYHRFAALRFKTLTLNIEAASQELTITVSCDRDYYTLQRYLLPSRRLYQLLSLHFKKVHLAFGIQGAPTELSIRLRTIPLIASPCVQSKLRDLNPLGTKLRRAINVALQGHIGVLKLENEQDVENLRQLWERGRIEQLMEQFGIVPFDDSSGQLIKLWKPRRLNEGENVVIIIE